jgi:hypothetical protein
VPSAAPLSDTRHARLVTCLSDTYRGGMFRAPRRVRAAASRCLRQRTPGGHAKYPFARPSQACLEAASPTATLLLPLGRDSLLGTLLATFNWERATARRTGITSAHSFVPQLFNAGSLGVSIDAVRWGRAPGSRAWLPLSEFPRTRPLLTHVGADTERELGPATR